MKNKINQLFKDKLVLVMLVLGLLTIVAAAGAVKIRKGDGLNEQNPYLEVPESGGILAENTPQELPNSGSDKLSETKAQKAGSSDASYSGEDSPKLSDTAKKDVQKNAKNDTAKAAGAGNDVARALVLNFDDTKKLAWPVMGNIILDYSMDSTIYFPTLDQFKCNPAVIIQSDVSQAVEAPADARVLEVGSDEEIGNYVKLDLGNDYVAVCGQLKDVQVVQDEYVYQGNILGYVSEPTKYYSVEGNNIYFELNHSGKPVDALDYLE